MSLTTKEEEEFNSISRRFQIIEDEFKEQDLINAQLEKDQENHDIIIANLCTDTAHLQNDMSEIHREIHILYPLPYAPLHF